MLSDHSASWKKLFKGLNLTKMADIDQQTMWKTPYIHQFTHVEGIYLEKCLIHFVLIGKCYVCKCYNKY